MVLICIHIRQLYQLLLLLQLLQLTIFYICTLSFLIGEKISDSINNDWLPKETNIQKLTRVRKAIDWAYQNPEQIPKTQEDNTNSNTSSNSFNTHHPIHSLQQTRSAEMIHVLHSLNMSALHEQSQQFKFSTIGDVGTILWGSLTDARTIDFKSKLAEDADSTAVNKTNLNAIKTKILKLIRKVNVTEPKINVTEQTTKTTECEGKKNITPAIHTTKTNLSTTDSVLNSTENVRTEITIESITDETGSIETIEKEPVKKELNYTHSTSSPGDQQALT